MDEPTEPASGMRDFLPADVERRERVFEVIREVYESHGFEPIETPSLERLSTLMGKYGEDEKLIFKVLKRGEKLQRALGDVSPSEGELADLALRYDLTVPLSRFFAEHRGEFSRFVKRYQIQPVWRADRPQKGRFREFYQCDVDVIGSESVMVEAEVAAALTEVLHRLGFEDVRIHTNHRSLLTALMDVAGVDDELRDEALVAIDKLDKIGLDGVVDELNDRGIDREAVNALMPMLEKGAEGGSPPFDNEATLERLAEDVAGTEKGVESLEELHRLLDFAEGTAADEHLFVDPYLARGLAYYTGTIFEIRSDDFDGSLGGGGRYDDLIGMFTSDDVPACGFSLGVERILVLMRERDMLEEPSPPADVLVTVWNEEFAPKALELADELREAGLRVDLYPTDDDGFGKQFGYANDRGIPHVAILAPDELEAGVVSVKEMESGDQEEIDRDDVAETLADRIESNG